MHYSFLVSFVLVLIVLLYSYKADLGISTQLLKNSIRAFVQLSILGYFLVYIFQIHNFYILLVVIFAMIVYSAYIAKNRVEVPFKIAFVSIFLSTVIVLGLVVALGIISTNANEFIPIGGMVVGNSLNTFTISIDRLKREISLQTELIEAYVALGASIKQAYSQLQKQAIKASLIPTLNMLQTIGVVAIPGITTGMLLAGADPLIAVSYQLVIIYMLVSINLFSSLFGVHFFTYQLRSHRF
ncbi:MAG: iron export ABC transporter permease subunit FetB [Epsilonproteobacteria bacterium]|nr:iron export ABC transporter permease subunit FetB [Campylobacterota bacterium]